MMEDTSSKQWIHFLRSDLCPPTSTRRKLTSPNCSRVSWNKKSSIIIAFCLCLCVCGSFSPKSFSKLQGGLISTPPGEGRVIMCHLNASGCPPHPDHVLRGRYKCIRDNSDKMRQEVEGRVW